MKSAAIKKASELIIDMPDCQMNNYLAQSGKSPCNASIALLLAFVTHLLINNFLAQNFQKKIVLAVMKRICVSSQVIGIHGPLITNPNI